MRTSYFDNPVRMERIRRTVKPMPVDLRHWRGEVKGCFKFIGRPVDGFHKASQGWYDNMRVYYLDWLYDLIVFPPDQVMDTAEFAAVKQKALSCLRYYRML